MTRKRIGNGQIHAVDFPIVIVIEPVSTTKGHLRALVTIKRPKDPKPKRKRAKP